MWRPELVGKMTLKYRDALDLPPITLEQLRSGSADGVFVPDRAPRNYTRRGPSFVDNPDHVPGFDDVHTIQISYPPEFVLSLSDAKLVGYRSLVSKTGFVTNDDSTMFVGDDTFLKYLSDIENPFHNEDTGFSRVDESGALAMPPSTNPDVVVDQRCICICGHEPANYGSFLFRALPKLATVKKYDIGGGPIIAYVNSSSAERLLEIAGVAPDRVIRHNTKLVYQLKKVLVPSVRNNQAFLDEDTRAFISNIRESVAPSRTGSRAIYVSRRRFNSGGASTRIMLNEEDVEARMGKIGLEVIYPEKMTVEDQIKTFASADLVVGPSGSALFNAIFCRPGTRLLDMESEPWWLHAHMCLFSSCDLDYGFHIGSVSEGDGNPHRQWSADVDVLGDRVADMLRLVE